MSDYGIHPTVYEKLSDDDLYSMFRESIYSSLSENEKLNLLQETVNRDALERGEVGSPEVRFSDMMDNKFGEAVNGVIEINREMAVQGIQTLEYNGQSIQHAISDYNCQTFNTLIHENVHCFQDQVIDGTISIEDAQKAAEYQMNDFTNSAVLWDGRYTTGSQYLIGETANGYYLYYFQATERDANLLAEEKTLSVLESISEKYGTEASFATYAKSVAETGYLASEQEAIERFQNPNFVTDLNQTLQNQYFGTNVPVDPVTEMAVKIEVIESYQSLQEEMDADILDSGTSDKNNSADDVSYDDDLDNVNNSIDSDNIGIDNDDIGIDNDNIGVDYDDAGVDNGDIGIDNDDIGVDNDDGINDEDISFDDGIGF